MAQLVHDFETGSMDQRGLLGGKGANLAEMTRLGIPVPPGFTVTTQACLNYLDNDNEMASQVWDQVLAGLRDELFDNVLSTARTARGVSSDAELTADDLRTIVARFRDIATQFPTDPY